MSLSQLALTNVLNVSVANPGAGLNAFNTSNLALFSDENPANSFGSAGYQIYLSADQVLTDFGSTSKTYAMALAAFAQQPNMLLGGGYLVIILQTVATENLALSGVAASGTFKINFGGSATAAINWNDTAAQIQAKCQAIAPLYAVVVTGSIASQSLNIKMYGVYGASPALITITNNSLQTGGAVGITFIVTVSVTGESLDAAITRTKTLVQYFGIMADNTCADIGGTDVALACTVVQALNKILFLVSYTEADIQPGGMLDLLRTGSQNQCRALFYDDIAANARTFMAAYAGLALSTPFSGSNTTQTMHLKTLIGIQPDPGITQAILNEAQTSGADCYPSIQGLPKVFCSGQNKFYDQVYNQQWLVGALTVAGFNYLAQSGTKIPQIESGMQGFKNALRQVMQQAVTNQYCAPGTWTSATTFGNQTDFLANISQIGYYIFSTPIAQQSQSDRAARKSPLVQIALKEAGAIHSATVVVNINP